ncbi:MAG: hypothetical protein CL607_19675 [Anaerolineaceae bacterium]|nr:hypothetical protein [Anaerolineaceae bacterium]
MDTQENSIFQYDLALDELGAVLQELSNNIRKGFDYFGTRYEERGYFLILSNIDIMLTLCQRYETVPDLESTEIQTWKQDFHDTFVRSFDKESSSQDGRDRQKAIVSATFGRLLRIVREYEDETNLW